MEIKFYPLDFEYRLKDGKVYMYLYSKLGDGSRVCVIHEHRPFFYVSIEGINTTELELRLKGLKVENRGEAAQVIEEPGAGKRQEQSIIQQGTAREEEGVIR